MASSESRFRVILNSELWNFSIIWPHLPYLATGIFLTLALTFCAIFLGTFLGVIFGVMRTSSNPFLNWPAKIFIDCFMSVPMLVLLVWLYYCLPLLINFRIGNFNTAILALSLSLAAFVGEIVAGGIESIPKGQIDAGLAMGLRFPAIFCHILLPQLLRIILSPLLTQYITVLKLSSLASVIAVYEILHRGQELIMKTFRPLEIYTVVAFLYMGIVWIFIKISRWIQNRIQWRY